MRIALASYPVKNKDIPFNTSAILNAMKECAGKADFILFGESVLQGFECLSWDYEVDRNMAVAQDHPAVSQIRAVAKEYGLAVVLGYIEKAEDALFSSALVIGREGETIHNFRRVSQGWKEYWHTDHHYREGEAFEAFPYLGKRFALALCGDLWTEGRPEEMKSLNVDAVLWPVWCDFLAEEWNETTKFEYAQQTALCGCSVLFVNPVCADSDAEDMASGGAAYFREGTIEKELPAGNPGILIVEI